MVGVRSEYRYVVTLYRAADGLVLGQTPVLVDWRAAWHWAAFEGFRRGLFREVVPPGQAVAEPIWHPKAREPYVAGFSLSIASDGAGSPPVRADFTLDYFKRPAITMSGYYVEKGWLREGEKFLFEVTAFACKSEAVSTPAPEGLTVEEVREPLPLREGLLADFARQSVRSEPLGCQPREGLPHVFIPQHVLDEAADLTRAAGEAETAGVLIGHLVRETSGPPEVFVQVTSQIHARHAIGRPTQLTFTPETWEAVHAALELRGRGELWVGWWHSHPRAVFEELEGEAVAFMSAHDCHIHREYFPRAYSIALVVTVVPRPGELNYTLFGWWRGVIVARGFNILGAPGAVLAAPHGDDGGISDAR